MPKVFPPPSHSLYPTPQKDSYIRKLGESSMIHPIITNDFIHYLIVLGTLYCMTVKLCVFVTVFPNRL